MKEQLTDNMARLGYHTLTPIQQQAIPAIMCVCTETEGTGRGEGRGEGVREGGRKRGKSGDK